MRTTAVILVLVAGSGVSCPAGAWQIATFVDLCRESGGRTIVRATRVLGDPEVIQLIPPCTIDVAAGATLEIRDLRVSVSGQRQRSSLTVRLREAANLKILRSDLAAEGMTIGGNGGGTIKIGNSYLTAFTGPLRVRTDEELVIRRSCFRASQGFISLSSRLGSAEFVGSELSGRRGSSVSAAQGVFTVDNQELIVERGQTLLVDRNTGAPIVIECPLF